MSASILIVDDEKHTREGLAAALEGEYEVFQAGDAEEAFRLLEAEHFAVVLTDLRMAGKSGLKVIEKALQLPDKPVCIMMTAYGNVETAVEAMKRGAYDFLTKPVSLEKLEILIRRALQGRHLETENTSLHQRLDQQYSFQGVVGHSKVLQNVIEQVKQAASTRSTVLLTGETGTGKELLAQMIHQNSPRARGPFVPVHCAALPASLLESELFGHEKGAFTGASERRIGRFEAADGGTLFLDEMGELDASTQVKLLRFLETRSFERLGSNKPINVDVRLVCATHRDLADLMAKGAFREDLFYRLHVVPIRLPPLREHSDDVPVLLDHFLKLFAKENSVVSPRLSAGAVAVLQRYPWPGNVRELRNFCENAVVTKRGDEITEYDLDPKFSNTAPAGFAGGYPGGFAPGSGSGIPGFAGYSPTGMAGATAPGFSGNSQPAGPAGSSAPGTPRPFNPLSKEDNEKRLLRQALVEARGNRTKAAQLMGISRRTLHRKIAEWPELDVAK
jgi:DNA-binding NtrC family response regulator